MTPITKLTVFIVTVQGEEKVLGIPVDDNISIPCVYTDAPIHKQALENCYVFAQNVANDTGVMIEVYQYEKKELMQVISRGNVTSH